MMIPFFFKLKNALFPAIPPKPWSQERLDKERAEFIKRFVSAHAEGNIALSRGHFTLEKKRDLFGK